MDTIFKVGVDVGNYDTKSQNTSTPSSFKEYATPNILDEEQIYYNGCYYSPTQERNNQQTDKTENGYCVIISLFAIAKEILFQLRTENKNITPEEIQSEIDKIKEIRLGIGLPAGHFSSLSKKTKKVYYDMMQNGISFEYRQYNKTYKFNFKLIQCSSYPQDYTGVAFNKTVSIPSKYTTYYVIGIGGGTVDIIPVINGQPYSEGCISLYLGTTVMYSDIIKTIQHETGSSMDYASIEAVLKNLPNIIDDTRKARILELKKIYSDKLVDMIIKEGVKLSDYPCVFIGGGCLLLKDALEENPKLIKAEFVEDVCTNAKYYAEFL